MAEDGFLRARKGSAKNRTLVSVCDQHLVTAPRDYPGY